MSALKNHQRNPSLALVPVSRVGFPFRQPSFRESGKILCLKTIGGSRYFAADLNAEPKIFLQSAVISLTPDENKYVQCL